MKETIKIGPISEKQVQLLNTTADITIFGGAAGSAKTYGALLWVLKYFQDPNTEATFFRRTFTQISAPGSCYSEAKKLFRDVYGKALRVKERDHELIAPNQAKLRFKHFQHESKSREDSKGMQSSLIIIDEGNQFSSESIIYLMSRLRSARVSYKPKMLICTNPDYDSILRVWLEDAGYLADTGVPKPEESGSMRWFFRASDEKTFWYRTEKEAQEAHGSGPESGIQTLTFIAATVYDNPVLLKQNPQYLNNLKGLPEIEKQRLLYGNWFARLQSSGYYKRDWLKEVSLAPSENASKVRAWDLASTPPSTANPNPDYTRGVLMSKNRQTKVYTVEDIRSCQDRPHAVEELIFNTAKADGQNTVIVLPIDPGASGTFYARDLQRRLAEKGYTCKLVRPQQDKLTRFKPFASVCEARYVQLVKADWNKAFHDELETFCGDGKLKDDQVDACSDAFLVLNSTVTIPSLSLPNMQRQSFAGSFAGSPSNQFTIPTFATSSFGNN